MCSANSTQQEPEVKPLIQDRHHRIDPAHAAVIDRRGAVDLLNGTFRVLLGINAISTVLLAHSVATDCDEPIVAGNIEGGLLDALVSLSYYAAGDIEFFADRTDDQYNALNKPEVRNG